MEKINSINQKIVLVILVMLSIIGITFSTMAKTKLYTEGLKKGDVLSFTKNGATSWCVYKNKADAKKTGIKLAKDFITPKDKITILGVASDCNVLKVKVENDKKSYTGFIQYGSTASKYFEKVKKEVAVKKITLDSTKPLNMKKGETVQVKATITPADATYKKVEISFWNNEWNNLKTSEASKTNIMKIKKVKEANGEVVFNITAKKAGTATLYVRTINDKGTTAEATREITITEPSKEVTEVKIDTIDAKLNIGDKVKINATVLPTNATNKTVVWTSSNEKVAKVNSKGKVTAISEGDAVITATAKGTDKKATCTITVKAQTPVVEGITLKDKSGKTEGTIEINNTIELIAEVKENTGKAENKKVGYTNNNTDVVDLKVENGKVIIKGVGKGETTIVARSMTDETKKAEYKIVVTDQKIAVTGVKISGETKKVSAGNTLQLTASVLPANAVQDVTWESKNEKIATVDEKGLVTISLDVKSGSSVSIVAKSKDNPKKYATWTIKVIKESIELNKTYLKLGAGETYQLKAKVSPAGTKVTFESSNTDFAQVDKNGKVTINNKQILESKGIKVGDKVTITAKAGNTVATCEIERITIAPGKMKIGETYDYSSNSDFKSIVQNETPNIIQVQKDGKTIKAKKAGKAKILWLKNDGTYCRTVWYVQTKTYNNALFNGKIYEVNQSVYCDTYTKHANKELDSGEHYWHLSAGDRFQVISMDGNWVKIKIVSLTETSKKRFKEGDQYFIFVSGNPNEEYFTSCAWEEI